MYGLVKAFARCLADKRAPGKIRHTLADLIGQRVFAVPEADDFSRTEPGGMVTVTTFAPQWSCAPLHLQHGKA